LNSPNICSCTQKVNDLAEKSKILLDTGLKIILLDHQNNFVATLKIMSDAAKSFDIPTTSLSVFYIIILIVQQNYFSDLHPILDLSAKSFFPCIFLIFAIYHNFQYNF